MLKTYKRHRLPLAARNERHARITATLSRRAALVAAFLVLAAFFAVTVQAQTVTVTASQLMDGDNPANGVITWSPVLSSGQAASYRHGSGGQRTVTPSTAKVTNGAFTLTLPDTSLTNPKNLCFSVILTGTKNPLGPGYSCVQPAANNSWCTSGSCNFDNYTPNLAPQVQVSPGPQGPPGKDSPSQGVWNRVGTVLYPSVVWGVGGTVAEPNVFPNEPNPKVLTQYTNVWKMWYTGGSRTCYAESPDGLNWTQYTGGPALFGCLMEGVLEPTVIKNGSTFYLFVNNTSEQAIDVYTSTDGVTFTRIATNVIPHGNNAGGAFIGGTLYLFVESDITSMHLYTSMAPYTTYSDQGVVGNGTYRGPTNPVQLNGKWWMWVHDDTDGVARNCSVTGGVCSHIERLSAPTITGPWTNSETTNNGDDFWPQTIDEMGVGQQEAQVADPFIVEYNGQTYLYYTSTIADAIRWGMTIKLAMADMPMASLVQTNGGPTGATDNNPFGIKYDWEALALDLRSLNLKNVGDISSSGNISAAGITAYNLATTGQYTTLNNGYQGTGFLILDGNSWGGNFQMCAVDASDCYTMQMDYQGSYSAASGSVGHGQNFKGGRNLGGYGDNYWFRDLSGNVFLGFVNTGYPAGNMGPFTSNHDVVTGGNVKVKQGTNQVYRCTTAGTKADVGTLTTNSAACGASVPVALFVN